MPSAANSNKRSTSAGKHEEDFQCSLPQSLQKQDSPTKKLSSDMRNDMTPDITGKAADMNKQATTLSDARNKKKLEKQAQLKQSNNTQLGISNISMKAKKS